jgi:hypothetical protein
VKYDRTVIAYHGCDATTAKRVLSGDAFKLTKHYRAEAGPSASRPTD